MPFPGRRFAAVLFATLVMGAGVVSLSSLPAGAARSAAAVGSAVAAKAKAVATLAILEPNVSVRRKGDDVFEPATDGQKLRVGDTVKTDETGFAQVNYTDESFTRLDVDTTFTIVSLTDDEGNRQISGSVETGSTWNRTSALTESESFEQEGAGATAAVVGTAFMVSCTTPDNCTFTSVVHGIRLTTVDDEIQNLDPLEACDSTEITTSDANLCGAPSKVTLDAILANEWILANLFLDGEAGFEGIVVVANGRVVSVTSTPAANEAPVFGPPVFGPPVFGPPGSGPPGSVPPGNEPPGNEPPGNELPGFDLPVIVLPPPPIVGETGPITITDPDLGPTDEIVTPEGTSVVFVFNVTPAEGTFITFDASVNSLPGTLYYTTDAVPPNKVNPNQAFQYEATDSFTFVADAEVDGDQTAPLTFVATNIGGSSEAGSVDVTVTDTGGEE